MATLALSADQVTWAVSVCVEPSVQVPVAEYGCVRPLAMEAVAGETAIETSSAGVTSRKALPLMPASVAAMRVVPTAAPVATAPESVATPAVWADHAT